MQLAQLVGPLSKNVTYTCPVPAGRYSNVHIGIETPQVPPLSEVQTEEMVSFVLGLNTKKFRINASDILEFVDLNATNITITPLQDIDRYTIIQVGYAAMEN